MTKNDITYVGQAQGISEARARMLQVLFATTNDSARRAEYRERVQATGTHGQLIQWAWDLHLSTELPTGTNTVKTRRGIGYNRR